MGINAIFLVRRVPAAQVDDARLDALSAGLCRDFGMDRFFVLEGFDAIGDEPLPRDWTARFGAHPFLNDLLACPGTESARRNELYQLVLDDIGPRPARLLTAIGRSMAGRRADGAPAPGLRYEQVGPPVDAEPGECLLEMTMPGRYYSEDYDRGDPMLYAAIAGWLEARLPGCEIWYGGDSGGALIEPFDPPRRQQLIDHARTHGNWRGSWPGTDGAG